MREQVALITGASSGIGTVVAEALATEGFQVFAGVRRPGSGDTLRGASIAPAPLDTCCTKHTRWRATSPLFE
jgi:NAD(P)-dependent dehydrogenase (short-subunit alcohol dehydrogenase family)